MGLGLRGKTRSALPRMRYRRQKALDELAGRERRENPGPAEIDDDVRMMLREREELLLLRPRRVHEDERHVRICRDERSNLAHVVERPGHVRSPRPRQVPEVELHGKVAATRMP